MRDAFEIYREWFQRHYGREFACTREQWAEWCSRPAYTYNANDARLIAIIADQHEIDRERSEGWTYDHLR